MPRQLPTDAARRAEHLWQYATVTDLDCEQRPPAVKVQFDDEQFSDWIPFMQPRAGRSFVWMPPQVGEQGIVLSSGGEMEALLFVGGIFTEHQLPENPDGQLVEIHFENGDYLVHDPVKEETKLELHTDVDAKIIGDIKVQIEGDIKAEVVGNIEAKLEGRADIEVSDEVSLKTPKLRIDGDVVVAGDVIADGVSLKAHKHKGVKPGKSLTKGPV